MIAKNPPSCQRLSRTTRPGVISATVNGCRNFPWRNARARDTTMDQDQLIEIARFRIRKTGDNRKDRADRQLFPTSAALRDSRRSACRFTLCSLQEPQLGYPPGSSRRKERWRQAGPIGSRVKGARHPQSEQRLVCLISATPERAGRRTIAHGNQAGTQLMHSCANSRAAKTAPGGWANRTSH